MNKSISMGKFIFYFSILIVSFSQWYAIKVIPLLYLLLTFFFILVIISILKFKIFLFLGRYKLYLFLILANWGYTFVSIFEEYDHLNYFLNNLFKSFLIALPFLYYLLLESYNFISYKILIKEIKILTSLGIINFFLSTFIVCYFDPYLGKFLTRPFLEPYMHVTSNSISENYIIFTLPYIYLYYSFLNKKKIFFLFYLLSFIHLSKSNLVALIISSILTYVPFFIVLLILSIFYLILKFTNVLENTINIVSNLQIKKILIGLEIIKNGNISNFTDWISIVGDPTRAFIYSKLMQYFYENYMFCFVPFGSYFRELYIEGYDYHNSFVYIIINNGLSGFLFFVIFYSYILYKIIKETKYGKFAVFLTFYFFIKGSFSTLNIYLILINLVLYYFIAKNLTIIYSSFYNKRRK